MPNEEEAIRSRSFIQTEFSILHQWKSLKLNKNSMQIFEFNCESAVCFREETLFFLEENELNTFYDEIEWNRSRHKKNRKTKINNLFHFGANRTKYINNALSRHSSFNGDSFTTEPFIKLATPHIQYDHWRSAVCPSIRAICQHRYLLQHM